MNYKFNTTNGKSVYALVGGGIKTRAVPLFQKPRKQFVIAAQPISLFRRRVAVVFCNPAHKFEQVSDGI